MQPFVSVIIPTFNRADFLQAALSSALNQVRVKVEVIVVDDASTDSTASFVSTMAGINANVRLIRHQTNQGVSAARNTGIRAAKGDYIAILDSDDVWAPQKLRLQYLDLKRSPYSEDNVLSFTYYESVYDPKDAFTQNAFIRPMFLREDHNGIITGLKKYSERELEIGVVTRRLWIGFGSTLFAHKEAIRKTGMFDKALTCGEDTELVFRHLAGGGEIRAVPRLLMSLFETRELKQFPGQDVYQHYLVDKYRCAIAERWGETVARQSVDSLREDFVARNWPERDHREVWNLVKNEVLPIPPSAPCERNFACGLRGTLCRAPA